MSKSVAVVGNPNVGKTTLFNSLTGLALVTANYPGVTVERKLGRMRLDGETAHLIDLPGAYSLSARSPDEMIVADVLLNQQVGEEPIDAVLAVVDASNLERNLYLVTQLLELGKPMVVALNMCDVAERLAIRLDARKLSERLGIPVVPVCAHRRAGEDALRRALAETVLKGGDLPKALVEFPESLRREVDGLTESLNAQTDRIGRPVSRFEAFRILVDRGGYAEQRMVRLLGEEFERELAERRARAAGDKSVLSGLESLARFEAIRRVLVECMGPPAPRPETVSDRADIFLTHPVLGTAVFVVVMAVMFQSIYNAAAPIVTLMDKGLGMLAGAVDRWLPDGVLNSLIVDGCVAGVGSVLAFLPQIVILSLFIAILEDCGYLARAAYLMDRFLFRCGLSGHSFIPLLSSFACAIPGILATRTISDRRDRLATILVAPLMSCSARLPVYSVMIAAFVPNTPFLGGVVRLQGLTLLLMYCIGVLLAAPMAWLFKKTMLRGATPPFLLELPTYKWPQTRTVALKVFRQGKEFVKRAGTLIFALTIVTWALAYFPRPSEDEAPFDAERTRIWATTAPGPEQEALLAQVDRLEHRARLENSYFGRAGSALAFAFRPLGWDWRIGMATLTSFPAREVVVATLGIIFNIEEPYQESGEGLVTALRRAKRVDGTPLFTVPVALSLMVFFALCCQCGGTLAVIRRETNSWGWPLFTFAYMTALAYVGALAVFQIGMAVGRLIA